MEKAQNDIVVAIIVAIIVTLILCVFTLLFFLIFIRKRKILLWEKELLKQNYQQELLKSRLEVQEQTLKNVAREIHDNIGQVLSFIKLNLSASGPLSGAEKQEKIDDSKELVAQVITDLRDLSKSLSMEHISKQGLVKTITAEVQRLNKTGIFSIDFNVVGQSCTLGEQRELVLYRIFQESVNNVIKHAKATIVKINLQYSTELFTLTVEDDGVGFDQELMFERAGSGLKNLQNRAEIIGAKIFFDSKAGEGCRIKVLLDPFEQRVYADGNYSSSPG